MRKFILCITLIAAVGFGLAFLKNGDPDWLFRMIGLLVFALALWLDYELHLADQEIEMQIQEWQIKQEREHEVLITKTAIRRELIKTWEKIA